MRVQVLCALGDLVTGVPWLHRSDGDHPVVGSGRVDLSLRCRGGSCPPHVLKDYLTSLLCLLFHNDYLDKGPSSRRERNECPEETLCVRDCGEEGRREEVCVSFGVGGIGY